MQIESQIKNPYGKKIKQNTTYIGGEGFTLVIISQPSTRTTWSAHFLNEEMGFIKSNLLNIPPVAYVLFRISAQEKWKRQWSQYSG